VCQQFAFPQHGDAQIVAYEPLVSLPAGPAVDIVHHMDLFVCDDTLGERFASPAACGAFSAFMHASKGPCFQLIIAYDKWVRLSFESSFPRSFSFFFLSSPHLCSHFRRGAAGFALPRDIGFRVGPNTPYSRYLLQIHYLLPMASDSNAALQVPAGYSPGVRVWFTPDIRPVREQLFFIRNNC
jgi:hypothetical protein